MLGPFRHLIHLFGDGAATIATLACLFAAAYLAVVGPGFRGLLLPALPLRAGGRFRRTLRISSYLARGYCAAYLVAVWAVGLLAGYWIVIGVFALGQASTGRTLVDHLMGFSAVILALVMMVLVPASCYTAAGTYRTLRRWEQARIQRRRDRRAKRTLAAIENGAPAPYGAYSIWLRPFNSTGRSWVIARSSSMRTGRVQTMTRGTHFQIVPTDLETLLATVMEPIAPVIALGRSGEQVGAGRVDTPDDRWQEVFALLARSARVIFLLPSRRGGTHWELDFLVREPTLLDRTVFLVPPAYSINVSHKPPIRNSTVERAPGAKLNEARAVREESLQALRDILPPDDYAAVAEEIRGWNSTRSGALFKLGNDGDIRVTALARLQVGETPWYYLASDGPRFDQSLFRAGLLEMVQSTGSPPPGRRVHENRKPR